MTLDRALQLHRAGRLAEAEQIYRSLYESGALDPRISYYLGVARLSLNRNAEAIAPLERAAQPGARGEVFRALGEAYERSGRMSDAARAYAKGVAAAPADIGLRLALSAAMLVLGDAAGSLRASEAAIALNATIAIAHNHAGLALQMLGRPQEAEARFRVAVQLAPDWASAALNLGNLLSASLRFAEAEPWMRKAFALAPDMVDARAGLAQTLRELGHYEETAALIEALLAREPTNPTGLVLRCMSALRPIYRSQAEMEQARTQYDASLKALDQAAQKEPTRFLDPLSKSSPFYLAYQGREDCDLQRRFGGLLERVVSAALGDLARAPAVPSREKPKARLGIVGGHFRMHSIWKIPLQGWLAAIDRSRFEVFCYHTAPTQDVHTQFARDHSDDFVDGLRGLTQWAERIAADHCDILLYPEIGMEELVYQLAAARLAPVQVNGLGHPITSGLSTMDAAFSSALMEPPEAEASYVERLIRLPNLGVYYERPIPPVETVTRSEFGIGEDRFVFWCPQSLFKYLPEHDDVFARIAKDAPKVQFAFVSYFSVGATDIFARRLRAGFAHHGLAMEDFCVFLPRLTQSRFAATAGLCNAMLDSIGWSGFNSSMESMVHDLPIIAFRGQFMRSRHSAAILERMNIAELIADDVARYVGIAQKLAADGAFYDRIKTTVAAARPFLYRDQDYAAALNEALAALIAPP